MNLSKKEKVKYICEVNDELGYKRYLRREYIAELDIWGKERVISEQTFSKRVNEGFKVEYRNITIDMNLLKNTLTDINDLIDLTLYLKDEIWFKELIKQKQVIEKYL